MNTLLPLLPPQADLETRAILKQLVRSHQALAELKGVASGVPNEGILISTLSLQEAKDSSAIENIITTEDELFRSDSRTGIYVTVAAREVYDYATALRTGFEEVRATGLLTNNNVLSIQACIEKNSAGFRKLPGTALKNQTTGETVYTPPQHPEEIERLMANLERFINDNEMSELDPLVKMAVIHHQFESIHPFYDGNGRTGRILNILYMVQQGLLDVPVLYLSRYVNQTKGEYCRLLQAVRTDEKWEDWVLYMLVGVERTSVQTTRLVNGIKGEMLRYKQTVRRDLPSVYSQDLINHLFRHPYTKIPFVAEDLQISRNTAIKYLDQLVEIGLLSKHRLARENLYLNDGLIHMLVNASFPPGQ